MEEHHPGATSMHLKEVKGNRKDIACEVDGPTFMNRQYYVDFLDWRLKSEDK